MKVLNVLKNVFTWLLVVAAVCMMVFTVVSVTTFDRNDRNLFGYKAFICRSDSMKATDFAAGDLVFVKEVPPPLIKPGDIISYRSEDPDTFGETFTHKVRSLITDEEGQPCFITYGTTTGVDDELPVKYMQVQGRYIFDIPKLGTFFTFLKTTPGYFICIFLPFMLLILMQGIDTVKLFRKYKKEQMEELTSEREKLEEERRQTAEMMRELQALKEQLAAKDGQSSE
ncbi:MAG: signal peptidase I [Clostridia bacterium]|nr:signal peptidase I [Clostridia bacterium]